jgi:hypothetical protein
MARVFDLRSKPVEKDIPIDKLIEDFDLYPRTAVNSMLVNQYREAYRAGAKFPRIKVDQKYRIIDGFHRTNAFRLEGVLTIPAIVYRIKSDVEFFEASVSANSGHGERFSSYDRAKVIARAEELGIEKKRIASMLAITVDTIESVEKGFANNGETGQPMPLKSSVRHLAGRTLTVRQNNAHVHIGGMQQSFYINQVLLLLEGNLLDYKNEAVMSRLHHLHLALEKVNFKKHQIAS